MPDQKKGIISTPVRTSIPMPTPAGDAPGRIVTGGEEGYRKQDGGGRLPEITKVYPPGTKTKL